MSDNVSLKLDKLIPGLANMEHDLRLKVGVLEGATNEEGESVAFYAAKNEFGTRKIPERPAMRKTLEAAQDKALNFLKTEIADKGRDPEAVLNDLGDELATAMTIAIKNWEYPPNSEEHRRWKQKKYGVDNAPLYMTGAYAGSIAHEVVKETPGSE